jgi:TonB-dependent SusC/RagA subfamily outer membrane receptor
MIRTADHRRPRPIATIALAAITLAPLLACASARAREARPAPVPTAGDPASVPATGGKTIENLFAGRFPGVTVSRADGGGLRILIRGGNNSFYGNEEPLYIVDDVPLGTGTGGIVFLNPYDIVAIEVLKNPADVALYGLRGGNGVIKITTTTKPDAP